MKPRFGAAEVRGLLGLVRELNAALDLDGFRRALVHGLPAVIPSDITAYNEADTRRGRITAVANPSEILNPHNLTAFERHMHEHPVLRHFDRTGDLRPRRISDLVGRRAWHALSLYNEFFRELRIEHQLSFGLASVPRRRFIGIALNRAQRDFTARERLMVEVLRPHLAQAYQAVETLHRLTTERADLEAALAGAGHGVAVLDEAGRVRLVTVRARDLLARYFDPARHPLPDAVRRWVRHRAGDSGPGALAGSRTPLVIDREGSRLTIRFVPRAVRVVLLLEEECTTPDPLALRGLGLTRRESEVLTWLSVGKTNPEIARILGLSPLTVRTHLERIYQKLGVETRTAAAVMALRAHSSPCS